MLSAARRLIGLIGQMLDDPGTDIIMATAMLALAGEDRPAVPTGHLPAGMGDIGARSARVMCVSSARGRGSTSTVFTMSKAVVELSHPISDGMLTYPGLPGPRVTTHIARDRSALIDMTYEIARMDTVGNTGTYINAPFHYHADGADIAELPLERVFNVPIVMIRAARIRVVGPDVLGDPARLWGKAVLVHTGWSARWGSSAYRGPGHPFLVGEVADALVAANVALVGIDSLDIDDTSLPTRPCHHTLLGAGIPIIEQMTNLDAVPDTGASLVALPAPVHRMGSFPLRVVAWTAASIFG